MPWIGDELIDTVVECRKCLTHPRDDALAYPFGED